MTGVKDATGRCVPEWCGKRCYLNTDWLAYFESKYPGGYMYWGETRNYWPGEEPWVGAKWVHFHKPPVEMEGWKYYGYAMPNARDKFWTDLKKAYALGWNEDLAPKVGYLVGGFIACVRMRGLGGLIEFPYI